ncbi:ABC transporter family substrate-binding protein [Streptomyces sp. LB8]|uniref:ABC transporter family substrate-binding protein n=1 Tax=Streptomyces thermogriseus TaxID=75292 RepID=A0ABN1T6C6_9ACTN|nr:ABC transporter family substrate-binding protein [Streptomyces sp. LB8]MDN5385432.1 ABC transporter family substrate-binding protein [Streptomyces sp. LB8]
MSYDGVGLGSAMRSAALLTAGALAVHLLAGCGSGDDGNKPLAGQDIAPAARHEIADGGTLRWAVDAMPQTLNTFQVDADAGTARIAQAVLPAMFRMDERGRPQLDENYLESARVVETEPKQVVVYRLNQQAVWSDGRTIDAEDFAAQWRALSGKDSAYWSARNAGYDRIQKVERGASSREVRVTFARPYADWRSLFSPLYPKDVMGAADSFNDGARTQLKVTAGPFTVRKVDDKNKDVVLARNPRWWGRPAKLSEIVLHEVPRDKRVAALADGSVDVADIDPADVPRITAAGARAGSPFPGASDSRTAATALRVWALEHGTESEDTDQELRALKKENEALAARLRQQQALGAFQVRKSLEPAYTQLALNGEGGPLADERVRHAVAHALNRKEIAELVLKPLGLPASPVGSHLALAGQSAYADSSDALGGQDTAQALSLLADAGWVPGPAGEKAGEKKDAKKEEKKSGAAGAQSSSDGGDDSDDGTYIVGVHGPETDDGDSDDDRTSAEDRRDGDRDDRNGTERPAPGDRRYTDGRLGPGGAPGAYAPKGTAAPAGAASGPLAKDGKPLTLRFVVPAGPGTDTLGKVAERITAMLKRIGITTEINKVSDESYFRDHIASGQYDLALYSWPSSAFPATDARPIYAKPVPAADGSLNVQQNYTRVGTDQIDQLFDQAVATLDEDEQRGLLRRADARIWAAAGSIPLYQRPQLTAVRKDLANVGAFGFRTPVYEDMGFLKKGVKR